MLPAAIARRPEASSIAAVRLVTVVFPFVPVTATIGTRVRSPARSISLRTGTFAARAAVIAGCDVRTSGLGTTSATCEAIARYQAASGRSTTSAPAVRACVAARVVGISAGRVVADHDVPALRPQPAGDRLARCRQPDHQRPTHSSPNRRKSA